MSNGAKAPFVHIVGDSRSTSITPMGPKPLITVCRAWLVGDGLPMLLKLR